MTLCTAMLIIVAEVVAVADPEPIAVLPAPVVMEALSGEFPLNDGVQMVLPGHSDDAWHTSAQLFVDEVEQRHGVRLRIVELGEPESSCSFDQIPIRQGGECSCVPCRGRIMLGRATAPCALEDQIPSGDIAYEEGYQLHVEQSVLLQALTPHGLHNGLMTLLQLVDDRGAGPFLPGVYILDEPRFRWRGVLLDPARSFLPPDVVMETIDRLSQLKIDVLHWHLTDDQGWRVEIRGLPRLHEVGGTLESSSAGKRAALARSGWGERGYYTREEVQEIVAHAADRHVTIVPEIDVPGHCSALLAAYPELSCSGEDVPIRTRPGIYRTALCPGKAEVYQALELIFEEVADLFPGEYVHLGGDEVAAHDWLDHPANRPLAEDLDIRSDGDLLVHFVAEAASILQRFGKIPIGWDELADNAPEGMAVQIWRHHEVARTAAERGHDVIVSPRSYSYLDRPPRVLDLRRVYSFEPIPRGLDQRLHTRVLGGEANLWGEYVTVDNLESKLYPRVAANAEVLWSDPAHRDFGEFKRRLRSLGL